MSKLGLHPSPRGCRAAENDTPPKEVSLSEEKPKVLDPKLFPEGTCISCQQITLHSLLKTHYGSVEKCWIDYDRTLPTHCPVCKLIFHSILHHGDKMTGNIRLGLWVIDHQPNIDMYTGRRIYSVRMSRYQTYEYRNKNDGQLRIYADPGSYASKFVSHSRAPPSNLSDTTVDRIDSQIKQCDETHTRCRDLSAQSPKLAPPHLPSRVVHVGSATLQPHLHIAQEQQSCRYVALSHCWGEIPQVRTLKANIEQYKEAIVFESLSKTFRDALHVTRRLRIDYIWIDSLCIVQDDEDDWLSESKNMGSIYTNAYITIAATSATDGNDGLDSFRPKSTWIRFPCDGTDEEKGHMWFTDASWDSQSDLSDAPLNWRGWVFQEKMLSRRIVHFASSQVYWECKESFVGEECEDRISFPGDTALAPSLFWATVNFISRIGTIPVERGHDIVYTASPRRQLSVFFQIWNNFVRYYSTRTFTRKTDRLVALMGIIRVVEKQTGLRCIDGHWDDGSRQFAYELMWFPYKQRALSVLDDGRRSRLCSSWSWASLEGEVWHQHLIANTWTKHGLKDCDLRLEVIQENVHVPWPSHPLKVSGMLRTVYRCRCRGHEYTDPPEYQGMIALYKCGRPKSEYVQQSKQRGRTFLVKLEEYGIACGWICFDREDGEPEQFYLAPVYIAMRSIACLALVERSRQESSERWFERVGAGYIEMEAEHDGPSSTRARVDLFEACERVTYCII